ncbi:Spo0E family sporulation regulatory protein-aspartic acid phosphatase [Thalassorhabdus alkalitolerans]|uniref:Spo0E family sporulation regulatory protein-aspartic acid phosphatase n=1 Tax=Thalassorhabdus alkalitolerans TaxID=2282697 RepID=A0ABW0YHC0_9BACI|nr:aspartyl-phosphate phosphatase Spo0E family protein [Bacillus sp. FJAT-44742]
MELIVLNRQIKSKKKEMYHKAKQFGINDPKTIQCSQELDLLLNQYQELKIPSKEPSLV